MCDLFIVSIFYLHEVLKFVLIPLELLLEADYAYILCQLCILLLRLGLQELQLFLNLVHVRLEGKPEVVLVLTEHIYQPFVISFQSGGHLIECASHIL